MSLMLLNDWIKRCIFVKKYRNGGVFSLFILETPQSSFSPFLRGQILLSGQTVPAKFTYSISN